jgi:uncharacterized radical SAM superfamily Fe-S cluster-containing enzyme
LVPSRRVEREGKVYLAKDCPKCGPTESLISSSQERHCRKRDLDPGWDYEGCNAKCLECGHHRKPRYAFVDVTNRCNLNCPMCADSIPGYGFAFDPPMSFFKRIFDHLATLEPLPTIALFGGEPTVREDLIDIIKLARSYGFNTRVLTNGLRLADEEYCREMVKARPHLLVSYDGANAETYRQLRHSAKVLDIKKKAIENLAKTPRAKVSFVTLFGWGLNHQELPELLKFYHQHRAMLQGVYLMPLVHTWDFSQFDYKPERMTTECVEKLLNDVFPDYRVEFISLGLASHFVTVMKYLGSEAMPYYGAHPNCESFYALVTDGEKYLPIDHYLRGSFTGLAEGLLELERKLAAREDRWQKSLMGRAFGAVRLRNFTLRLLGLTQLGLTVLRRVRWGRLFKGWGPTKIYHALMTGLERLLGRDSEKIRKSHLAVDGILRIVILPLEDNPIVETERLERCPSTHVYLDPRTDTIHYVPVCAWRLHAKQILGELTAYYENQKEKEAAEPQPAEAVAAKA